MYSNKLRAHEKSLRYDKRGKSSAIPPFVFERFRLKLSTSLSYVYDKSNGKMRERERAQKFDCEDDNLQLRGIRKKGKLRVEILQ